MVNTWEDLVDLKKEIIDILENVNCFNVRIFGSFARKDNTETSDVDICVDVKEIWNTINFDIVELEKVLLKLHNERKPTCR